MPKAQVYDRIRPVKANKGRQPCRYEVAIFHTEADWDSGDWKAGEVAAKFQCAGDAVAWANQLAERLAGIHCIAVSN